MILRRIFCGIVFLACLVVLELNKNRLLGWLLWLAVSGGVFWLLEKNFAWWQKLLIILGWIGAFALIVLLSWPPVKKVPAADVKNPEKTEIVTVKDGDLQGVYNKDKDVEVFAGIPYAAPPVGENRWKAPQDPAKWEGVRQADTFAPMSMQPQNLPIIDSLTQIIGYHDYHISLKDNYRPACSEDSLYLNVWKPAGEKKNLPVLVFIHGGSMKTGQTWYEDYSGEGLAKKDVIVVNLAYRLGVFGFYADEDLLKEDGTTGNYALLDQIKALQWVQDNIAAFGGDPSNVTLAGESAGSASVSALCASPMAKGLFRRAVMESSTVVSKEVPHSFRSLDEALASGKALKEKHHCKNVEEMRKLSAEEIVADAETEHHITIDGMVLEEQPYETYKKGKTNEEAVLHGANEEESGPFILFDKTTMKNYEEKIRSFFKDRTEEVLKVYPASNDQEAAEYWAEIYGAIFFNYPHDCLERLETANGIPTYQYLFSKQNKRLGSWHSGEMVYFYNDIPEKSSLYDESDRRLEEIMSDYLVNFVKRGNPNGEGLPEWKDTKDEVMNFNTESGMKKDERRQKLYRILDEMQGFSAD